MMAQKKKFLTIAFLFLFLFSAGTVFALEITYPPVPGAQTPNQIQEGLDKGYIARNEALPLYINYFIRFFYLLAIGIVVIILIWSGVAYSISGLKPVAKAAAKQWLSNGFLGLFILLISYLILAVINPQLLIFKAGIPTIPPITVFTSAEPSNLVVFREIPFGTYLDETLKDIDELETTGKWAGHHRIEVPILEIREALTDAITLTEKIKAEMAKCACGLSQFHVEWDGSWQEMELIGKCAPGLDEGDTSTGLDLGPLEGAWDRIKDAVAGGQETCLTRCGACGKNYDLQIVQDKYGRVCDLREIQEKKDDNGNVVLDTAGNPVIEIKTTETDWQEIEKVPNAITTSIKYNKMQLAKTYARLATLEQSFHIEQIDAIIKTLNINAGNFLLSNAPSIIIQENFNDIAESIKERGFEVGVERPKQFPETGLVTMSPTTIDPFTIYYPYKDYTDVVVAPDVIAESKRVTREADRFSIFSVLTQLSLEEIEKMIQDCFNSAFGQGEFLIDPEQFLKIAEDTIRQGLYNLLGKAWEDGNGEIVSSFFTGLKDDLKKEVSSEESKDKRVSACLSDCGNTAECQEKCNRMQMVQKCKSNCVASPGNQTPAGCQKNCETITIPPHFLSNALADLMTKDILDQLPPVIKETLNETLLQTLTDTKLEHIITDDLVKVLDPVLQGALSKSMEQLIPGLQKGLQTTMTTILDEFGLDFIQPIDKFLAKEIKNLKKTVDSQVDYVGNFLGGVLTAAIGGEFQEYKDAHFYEYTEAQPPMICWGRFMEGYYYEYQYSDPFSCSVAGVCKKATLDDVNGLGDADNPVTKAIEEAERCGDLEYLTPGAQDYATALGFDTIEGYCRKAGFCWDLANDNCKRCSGDYYVNLNNLKPTQENFRRLAHQFFVGLVNFSEQFLVALIQTTVYTLTQFAKVWVEDTILLPLEPYITQLTDFQQKLHKFLYSSIKDILPQQIQFYLSSNIDQVLADICSKSTTNTTIKLYRGVDEIEISPEVGKHACNLHEELHQSLLDNLKENRELGEQISEALEARVYDLLCQGQSYALCHNKKDKKERKQCYINNRKDNCISTYLQKSPAEIFWPELVKKIGLSGLTQAIKGTPKQVICSELSFQNLDNMCGEVTNSELFGLFPIPNKDKWKNLNEEGKAYCVFYWFGCKNIFSAWNKTTGQIIKTGLVKECQKTENQNKEWCDVVAKKSVIYTSIKYGIEKSYGATPTNVDKEISAYQWLTATFSNTKIRSDIEQIIKERGLIQKWTKGNPSPKEEAEKAGRNPDDFEGAAMAFVSWFAKNSRLYDVLTEPQFGVMTYLQGDTYAGKNFLSRSPYQLLHQDLCVKIKKDFKKDYAYWTIEAIASRKMRQTVGEPKYSIESLDITTKNEVLAEFLAAAEAPEQIKEQYFSCVLLDHKPSQILGLDQQLVRYIRPVEYQILFDLMNDKLDHQKDMPYYLRDLLENYLYGSTPVTGLAKLGNKLEQDAITEQNEITQDELFKAGANMKTAAVFLDSQLGSQLNRDPLNQEIIVLIFKVFCEETYQGQPAKIQECKNRLNQRLGWEGWKDLQDILAMTPGELIEKYLDEKLIQGLPQKSIMEMLAEKSFLGQPYIDALGKAFHIDRPIYEFYLDSQKAKQSVDEGIRQAKGTIESITHKVFLDYPKAALNWIGQSLGSIIGVKSGERAADVLAGTGCRKAGSLANCQSGEVFNSTTKECCNMGQGMACAPRCREKPDTDNMINDRCKIEKGEIEETKIVDGVEKEFCCYKNCWSCREPREQASGPTCWEGVSLRGFSAAELDSSEDKQLCCKERTTKDINGVENCCVNIMQCVADKFTEHLEAAFIWNFTDGPALNELAPDKKEIAVPPPTASTCPIDQSKLCMTPEKLAQCNNTPFPAVRNPGLQNLMDCIEDEIKKDHPSISIPAEGQNNSFYGSVFTIDNDYDICNFTRGERVCETCQEQSCSKTCSHGKNHPKNYSCHYGGENGQGALAVDFGNEDNLEKIKPAAIACMVRESGISETEAAKHVIFEGKEGEDGAHIHISHPDCDLPLGY